MGVNSLRKTVTRQCRDCDLNLGPSAPESSMLTTRLASHLYFCITKRNAQRGNLCLLIHLFLYLPYETLCHLAATHPLRSAVLLFRGNPCFCRDQWHAQTVHPESCSLEMVTLKDN